MNRNVLRCIRYRGFVGLGCACLLAACNGNANNPDADAVTDMPPIHLDQRAELLVDGKNAEHAAYVQAVDACEAGGLPTRRLQAEEEKLVGITRYEMWLDANGETSQTRSWKAVPGSGQALCQFKLELSGTFTSTSKDMFTERDLATGAEEQQAMESADELQRFAIAPEEERPLEGFHGPVAKQVAGQPCDEWTTPDQNNRFCVWSGGRKWGFGSTRGDDVRPSRNGFVLEASPADGNGYRMTTQTLTVGQAFAAPTAATEKH